MKTKTENKRSRIKREKVTDESLREAVESFPIVNNETVSAGYSEIQPGEPGYEETMSTFSEDASIEAPVERAGKIPLDTPLNVVLFPTSKQTETTPNFSGKITNDKGDTVAQILMYDKTTYKGVKRWQGLLLDGGGGSERIAMDLIENTEEGANPPDIRSMLFVEGVSYSIILWRKTYAYGTYYSGRIG